MRGDHHELPTPRTTLRTRYVRVLVWRKSCRHRRYADLQALVASKRDVPLIHLWFRGANCGSRLTDGDGGNGPAAVNAGRLTRGPYTSGITSMTRSIIGTVLAIGIVATINVLRAREVAVTVNRILIGLAVAFAIIAIVCDAIGITWAALVPALLAGIALGRLR
jgi:hypothetical protein